MQSKKQKIVESFMLKPRHLLGIDICSVFVLNHSLSEQVGRERQAEA
jgi:hypothetical protein